MNIQWVLADTALLDPTVNLDALKDIGAFWGSWTTWRAYNTDNVVCYNHSKAKELVTNKFNQACNLYIPQAVYEELNKPQQVRAFGSDFAHPVDHPDEIVSLFLAASTADIVLLLGFDWSNIEGHYFGYVLQALNSYPDVQFVLIDSPKSTAKIAELDNVMQDTMQNVLEMFD